MRTAINHRSAEMKMPTLLKPSFLQPSQTRLSSRVSVRVAKPSEMAQDQKTKAERSVELNRYYENTGFPDGIGY